MFGQRNAHGLQKPAVVMPKCSFGGCRPTPKKESSYTKQNKNVCVAPVNIDGTMKGIWPNHSPLLEKNSHLIDRHIEVFSNRELHSFNRIDTSKVIFISTVIKVTSVCDGDGRSVGGGCGGLADDGGCGQPARRRR